ncbi:MAG TPA: TIM barrel protein [Novosphingobium sp.]
MVKIGLDFLSALGMPPVRFIELAASLGCNSVTFGAAPLAAIDAYPRWSFRSAPQLVQDTQHALADNGISVAAGEGWFILPGRDIRDSAGDLDILATLGAKAITVCGLDPDIVRSFDQIAHLAEMAVARGLGTNIEFVASLPIGDLGTALDAVAHAGRPEVGLVIDAMHLFRSGANATDVAVLDPSLIRHVQLCDAPAKPIIEDYGYEASFERLRLGEGELPLADLVAVLVRDDIVGLEIPMKSRADAGADMAELLRPSVDEARRLVSGLVTLASN